MSDDPSSQGGLPDEVSAWLADVADERGLTEEELLDRLVSGDGAGAPATPPEGVADLEERVDALETSVSELNDALDDQIEDVRDRVIQVKRETDAKAPREHDHPDLAERLQQTATRLEALGNDFVDLTASVDRLEEDVDEVDDRLTRGFSNYEEVLEYLVDATDDLNGKVDTIARTVVALHSTVGRLDAAGAERKAVDRLREQAQEHGVTSAKCEDCGESVHLGLLTSPGCPHCESSFVRLDPSRSFFRSSVLRTGRRPALEGTVEDVSGIGSAYAERLRDAGVETVGQLAVADPAVLAEETEVPPARVDKWVSRARELVEST
jgi:outer membrane murein-binding lipoprotein Lpp